MLNSSVTYMIYDRYTKGENIKDIAIEFGIKLTEIYNSFTKYNLKLNAKVSNAKRRKVDYNLLVKDYIGGMSLSDISKKYNMKSSSIREALKRSGINLRPRGEANRLKKSGLTKNDEQDIIKLYLSDIKLTCAEIGRKYGVDKASINRILRNHNIQRRHRRINYDDYKHEVVKLYTIDYLSTPQIAKKLGITYPQVKSILINEGIKLRSVSDSHAVLWGITEEKEEQIIIIFKQYYFKCKIIGRMVGCSARSVRRVLLKHNLLWNIEKYLSCTKLYAQLRGSKKYNQWRQQVLIRDEYRCQKTGSMENVEVHHITPFIKLLRSVISDSKLHPIENVKELYQICLLDNRLWDIKNGVTLSSKAHHILHDQYITA